jgi:RNA polymerase sigma-70 factor (ECF subfamily)
MHSVQPDPGQLNEALAAAQRGDLAAFNTLVLAYQRQVFNVCYRTLGNGDDAADAAQDAFVSAMRGIQSFHGTIDGLRGWLLRIAVNACYDQLRRRQRRPSESLDALQVTDAGDESDRFADPRPGPDQRSLTAETGRQIQAALDRLPTEQRLTVVLCDVQGLSYDEVAEAMDVELGTVKSRLSRARAQLRTLLREQGELPSGVQRLTDRNP